MKKGQKSKIVPLESSHKLIGQKPQQLKQLHIYVTQQYPSIGLCFSTYNHRWSEVIISEIVYASLPSLDSSKSHKVHYKNPYNNKRYEKNGDAAIYIKGAHSEFPVDAFDHLEFQQSINNTTWNRKTFNHRTLGVYSSETPLTIDEENKKRILNILIQDNETATEAGKRTVNQAPFLKRMPGYVAHPASRKDTNLFSKNLHPDFIKRVEIFDNLSKDISENTDTRVLIHVLHGLPGMGKTQIAMQYADQHRHKFSNIWVIDGRNRDRSYRAIAERLDLPDSEDINEIRQMVHRRLEERACEKPWLLIFDNVNDPLTFEEFPEKRGHVLVTTTQASIIKFYHSSREIGPLKPHEAIQLIRSITKEEESEQMHLLAQDLSYFPLAINMAAHFVASSCSIADYIKEYDFKKCPTQAGMSQDAIYTQTLETVWEITFDKIQTNPEASSWLNICAYFTPDQIPNSWLKKWAKERGKDDWLKIKQLLRDYSVIQPGLDNESMAMHSLLQAVIRSQHKDDIYSSQACSLTQEALGKFDKGNNETWKEGLMGYTQLMWMIQEIGCPLPICDEACELLMRLHEISMIISDIEKSVQISYAFLQIATQLYPNQDHVLIAESLYDVARSFRESGSLDTARYFYEQSLDMERRLHMNRPHVRVANVLADLGLIYLSLENFENAKYCFGLSLKMHQKLGIQSDSGFAALLNSLGSLHRKQKDLEKARICYEESLRMVQTFYKDESHPTIATHLNNLGLCWYDLGNFEQARYCFEKSLAIQKEIYKNRPHPHLAGTLNNLGHVYINFGRFQDAKECYEESLKMMYLVHGDRSNPDIAICLHSMGWIWHELGDLKKARNFHERSLNMKLTIYKNRPHSHIAISLKSLGEVWLALEDLGQAKSYYSQAYEMQKQVLGEMDSETLNTKQILEVVEILVENNSRS